VFGEWDNIPHSINSMAEGIKTRNSKTVASMILAEKSPVEIINNPKGKVFFTCGSASGYVTKKVVNALKEGSFSIHDTNVVDIEVVDSNTGETKWLPCMCIRNTVNVLGSFGSELLK
jgi:23S rRNA maturation-related 3'-5' exoribonuclease YhaM